MSDLSISPISGLDIIPENANDLGITVELTSRCNLRCSYCSVPHSKTYGMTDMSKAQRDKALSLIRKRQDLQNAKTILSLSGRGELTFIEGWQDIIKDFQIDGIETRTVTNLAKLMTFEEAMALAELDVLSISIDTVDHALFKRVRKSVELRNIISNITMLKAAALHIGKPRMDFNMYAVITESTVFGVSKLAALAVALGANSLVLLDLVMDYSDTAPDAPIKPILSLPPDKLKDAAREIRKAQNFAADHNLTLNIRQGLAKACEIALDGAEAEPLTTIDIISEELGPHKRTAVAVPEGKTRNCLQPWRMALLSVNNKVELCCGSYGTVGSWEDKNSLEEIINAEGPRHLRQELLTGNLKPECRVCSVAPEIDVPDFQRIVTEYLESLT